MNDNIFFVSVSICNTLTLACRFSPPPLFFLFCIPSCVITEKEVSNHFDMKKEIQRLRGQCILNFLFIGSNAHSASLLFFISYMYLTIQHIIQHIFIKPSPFQQRCSCFWILFHKQTFFYQDKSVAHDTSEQRHAVLLQPSLYQKFLKQSPDVQKP